MVSFVFTFDALRSKDWICFSNEIDIKCGTDHKIELQSKHCGRMKCRMKFLRLHICNVNWRQLRIYLCVNVGCLSLAALVWFIFTFTFVNFGIDWQVAVFLIIIRTVDSLTWFFYSYFLNPEIEIAQFRWEKIAIQLVFISMATGEHIVLRQAHFSISFWMHNTQAMSAVGAVRTQPEMRKKSLQKWITKIEFCSPFSSIKFLIYFRLNVYARCTLTLSIMLMFDSVYSRFLVRARLALCSPHKFWIQMRAPL